MKFEEYLTPEGEKRWLAWGTGFTGDPRQARFKCDKYVYECDMLATTFWVRTKTGKFEGYPLHLFGGAAWHMKERLACRVALLEIRKARTKPSKHSRTGITLSVSKAKDIQELCRAAFNPARTSHLELMQELDQLFRTGQAPVN
ncbi:hypothetical protein Dthio_PD3633 [Desulfonatronospira thiodismutans ASO3-1]|uniref:Uncharacterized protein n=1 Tax=Desulfonatronospira thiodismutans ASO3-1 TaxID=555779 RepID=D6SJX4_9BACT|nr:hypothetical protein [Desulfonatronospira thiodismutans]EFI36177.1 hypothetical protein Dthio_PD3633 [Desulfonatronospira thiodismutans ASO3-1]